MSTADGVVIGTTQIFGTAPRTQAFNVVLLAEGFTTPQQNDFNAACSAFVTALTGTDPFGQVAHGAERLPRQRGIERVRRRRSGRRWRHRRDVPTPTSTRASAPTAYDACWSATTSIALQVALAQLPEFSAVLVVVNSQIYGGSGGPVGVFSLAAGATEIALHEMGHTAFGLADEYPYYAGGIEPDHDHHPPLEPSEPNVTINSDRQTLKWGWAVASRPRCRR